MLKNNIFITVLTFLISVPIFAHHYKGLPHNDYFSNYPQVPNLEFLYEDDKWEIFLTVYNFQGINLSQVQDNDMIRLYIFLYDVKNDKVYNRPTRFELFSSGKMIYEVNDLVSEEENIYSIHKKITEQDDLRLNVHFLREDGKIDVVNLPFSITKSFWEKYGLGVAIFLFFLIVGILKKFVIKEESK